MASAAGRKKSIVSSAGLTIETAGNTLLNKAASQSTSLYQQCSSLRSRLMRIHGFPLYFQLAAAPDARQSTDPVTQLWDVFSLGISLCYIFDQLPEEEGFARINHSRFNQEKYEANPDKEKKHAIVTFAMMIRSEEVARNIPGCELFTVTDLWDRKSTDGLVKVINTVTAIVDHLPPYAFEQTPPSPPLVSARDSSESLPDTLPGVPGPPTNGLQARRIYITREILETERKYVEGLEIMQKYATQLAQQNIIDQDTIHLLFPNLNNLLNFQRKFLIRFETMLEQPWSEQRWGLHFIECEEDFTVYEPYCSNFTNATELLVANEQNLMAMNHFISVSELKAFHITPIQRVCKYPLFFGDLIKVATGDETYPYLEELKRGSEAAHRITEKINEAHRRADNEQIVKALAKRITDWKGHHLENFGELLLEDVFVVTKSDIDREYHVFLFEKIILCCKEALQQPPNGRGKGSKNNSLLKKQGNQPPLTPGAQSIAQRDVPLLLKGRIFLGNVTRAAPVPTRASTGTGIPAYFPLQVWWKGDDDLEFFTLRCKSEDKMRKWESTINKLIKEAANRRASDRHGLSKVAAYSSPVVRIGPGESHYPSNVPGSHFSQPPSAVSRSSRSTATYEPNAPGPSSYTNGPQGYPPHEGFDVDHDDDDLEDYPPTSGASYAGSGRGTPVGHRRPNALSMPLEREHSTNGYDRPRAQTESTDGPTIAQWRSGLPSVPMSATTATGPSAMRPITPRLNSNMSVTSYGSEASFGPGLPSAPKQGSRPVLRSQFSSTRLKNGYDSGRGQGGAANSGSGMNSPSNGTNPTSVPTTRSRSASQPSAYVPKPQPTNVPPVPAANMSHWNGSGPRGVPSNVNGNKRGSGSSQSTGDSSDYSPNSSSPITPFGSSESSLGGVGRIPGMEHHGHHHGHHGSVAGPPVKVKVHFHEDIFVIQVPRTTEYEELVEKVGRKIRLCGPRRDDGPLRVKYRDEDGDMVSLGSTEDVQMAFEQWQPGGQVTLFVT